MLHTPNIHEPPQAQGLGPVLSLWHGDMTRRLPCGVGYRPRSLIAAEVAELCGLTVQQLMEHTSRRRIAWPRAVAMARMHAAGWSFVQCAAFFGLKDHTTALNAWRGVLDGRINLSAWADALPGGSLWTEQLIERS